MEYKHMLILAIFLLLQNQNSHAEKVMRPKILEQDIWSNEDYVKQRISLKTKEANLNVSVDVLKELSNVDFHIEGKIEKRTDPTYFFNFNTTFNLCVILNMKKHASVDAIMLMLLREYGRVPEHCPVTRGTYGVQKFWLPESPASATLPELNFDLHVHAYKVEANKERILLAKDHFQGHTIIMDVPKLKMGFMSALG